MELLTCFSHSRRANLYSGIILAISFATFAYSHLLGFNRTHEWTLLLFCFSETLATVFLLIRTDPKTVSVIHFDWLVAVGGTFAPLLLRPAAWGIAPFAKYTIAAGVMIQIAGLISLNRSFAIVAAKREIKTGGLYRFVRHPLYASYFLTYCGYVLANTTIRNLILYAITIVLLFIRVFREEEHLAMDIQYREYTQKVNYRIIPFVY
ncbi:MAG TPA: methyltransferase [Geobacteraceae bacterium]|nr:methyltransferase [Geobacteraceae bacterium]